MNPQSEYHTYLGMSVVVASPVMRRLLETVERAAKTNAGVLIFGESGSGKELIARAVHHHSLRRQKPWVDVSCAALPEHLVESELFGYERGAFSGADLAKPGLFEIANQGSLFLDEIGELDLRMQVKLLRVLDGSPYFRLGGTKKVVIDVRVIAATNQNLEEMAESGRFRHDLFHRLNQITLRVPPLRERPEDIVALAEHFLHQLQPSAHLSEDAKDLLVSHSWPGNIRELRNVITKATVLAATDYLRAQDFGREIQPARPQFTSRLAVMEPAASSDLEGVERHMILKVLAQTNGHQQRAAELLGISRRTLSRKLKIYELDTSRRNFVAS